MSWKQRYRLIEGFVRGKYYKYNGNTRMPNWASGGSMDFVLDHQPRLCIGAYGRYSATFEGFSSWDWTDGIENWEEC